MEIIFHDNDGDDGVQPADVPMCGALSLVMCAFFRCFAIAASIAWAAAT